MNLSAPAENLFLQLHGLLRELPVDIYSKKSLQLSGSTIGQHVRHILELFIQLQKGCISGLVNYEDRERDYRMETDPEFAAITMGELMQLLPQQNLELKLVADFNSVTSECITIPTNFFRELLYNIEHAVHHMALIRIGVRELTDLKLPAEFGIAASTIKYQQKICAQ